MPYEFKIDEKYEGISPKNFLKKKIDCSYDSIFKYIKDKRITLNKKKIKSDIKLKKGDIIKVWLDTIPKKEEKEELVKRISKNLKISMIYQNKDFLVLNKSAGVVVQGAQDNPTSLSYHLEYLRQKDKGSENYFHVHRLDKDTSGVLVCSKNIISCRNLNKVFRDKDMKKIYVCLCYGKFKNKKGRIEVNLERTPPEVREKVVVSKSGKYSLSSYNVIREYKFKGDVYSLVEVSIKTGVTHQIRVHMKYINHPIVCDKMYGNSFVNNNFKRILNRQFLHAKILEFKYNDKKYSFDAPLTDDLKKVIQVLTK